MILSPTHAMMAARILRREAKENVQAAAQLREDFPGAASNCEALADWYTNVAGALEMLDRDGTPIYSQNAVPDKAIEDALVPLSAPALPAVPCTIGELLRQLAADVDEFEEKTIGMEVEWHPVIIGDMARILRPIIEFGRENGSPLDAASAWMAMATAILDQSQYSWTEITAN